MNNPLQKSSPAPHAVADAARISLGMALRTSLVFIVLCGVLYPLITTGAAQLLMPKQSRRQLGHGFRRKGGRIGIDRPELYGASIFSRQGVQH